jgi:hypothetical protein
MATDRAVQDPCVTGCPVLIVRPMLQGNLKARVEQPRTRCRVARWLTIASGSTNDVEQAILHRAHEPREYFTWHKVRSVANIIALISPAASLPEWEA